MNNDFDRLLKTIEGYEARNEIEKGDRHAMLEILAGRPDRLYRSALDGHLTASSWICNRERNKVLLLFHKIYQSWAWSGGHADGEADLLACALREAMEETGLRSIKALRQEPVSLEILTVTRHVRRGLYVAPHLHLNLTYLLEADDQEMLQIKEDENSALSWFSLEEAVLASREAEMRPIYQKLNERLSEFSLNSD